MKFLCAQTIYEVACNWWILHYYRILHYSQTMAKLFLLLLALLYLTQFHYSQTFTLHIRTIRLLH